MRLVLPDLARPATVRLDPDEWLNDDEFFDLCAANPKASFERTAEGEILVVPPPGGVSDYRSLEVAFQLKAWAKSGGRGWVFGSTAGFSLPNGALRSPDAAWVSRARVASQPLQRRRKAMTLCPEFVVEILSPSDRLKAAQSKMREWMANGAQLGWLIDGDRRIVHVYREGSRQRETRSGLESLAGEGPMDGFHLDLRPVWEAFH